MQDAMILCMFVHIIFIVYGVFLMFFLIIDRKSMSFF